MLEDLVVKDTIDAGKVADGCEDIVSARMLCEATETLTDSASEDWLCEDAVSSVGVGELTCFVVGSIVDDWLLVELLERLSDEVLLLLLEVLD